MSCAWMPRVLTYLSVSTISSSARLSDADYASGEIGFYVQTFDVPTAHVHFDELTISNFEPSLVCEIKALTLHVRSGPGTELSGFHLFVEGRYDRAAWAQCRRVLALDRYGWKW